jgi:uncharacterized Tic20 family protein
MSDQITSPNPDDKILAGLSHLLGPIIALIIWATQKDKSPFVRFQAVQAMAFDATLVLLGVLGAGGAMLFVFCSSITGVIAAAAAPTPSGDSVSPLTFLFLLPAMMPLCIGPLIIILALGMVGVRIFAAVSVFQGNNFHYPWLGKRVERFLAQG